MAHPPRALHRSPDLEHPSATAVGATSEGRALPHPTFTELIKGPPASPWGASTEAPLDHLGWWSGSLAATSRRLAAEGLAVRSPGLLTWAKRVGPMCAIDDSETGS